MAARNVCLALALISTAACGGSGGSTAPNNQSNGNTAPPAGGISVTNNSFSPSDKIVAAGTAVRWAWNSCTGDSYSGQTCVEHSVTFADGTTSPTQGQGTYSRTFAAPGTYPYHCSIHGAAMTGTVTVQ